MNMNKLKITESAYKRNNILYIKESVMPIVNGLQASCYLQEGKTRIELVVNVSKEYSDIVKQELIDKIADVIAINYKYSFFSRELSVSGLSPTDRELLLTALISADVDDDKKYALKKLKSFEEYAIDGIFNFRMKPLKIKWQEILSYIPNGFQSLQLKDFITYLIKDKSGKKVYFEDGCVYDKRFNLLKRRSLLSGDSGELPIVKEVLLSGAGEIELGSPLPSSDEGYLKEFFADRIRFQEGYYKA